MASLARDLRKELEKTVKQARSVAEAGARKVLEQHGVHHHEPYGSMTPEQRALRNSLRAHGRQLGDRRDSQKGTQTIGRLVQECAYEHWHRMLFARFLAETDLLIEPQSGVAISLGECQELAREEGSGWLELASEYAERMLPQIFRTDDPVLAVTLPPETRSDLEDLLKDLPRDVFNADDSLGWVYQFWQAEKKEEVNRSESKIGADELPAVTQLFTEDYMVLFLLHNTIGAWWAGKVLADNRELAITARSEDELRTSCKVGDVDWTYLRFVRDEGEDGAEGPWRPAAGSFDGWPKAAKDLTVLDPCMGSGHFLVFALPIFAALRMAEDGLNETAAIDAVLLDNLYGLEIDPRCTQIAAFNLAFAAWKRTGFHRLPPLNLACSGLAIGVSKAEWLKLAEKAVAAADPAAKRDLLGTEDNLLTHGLEARIRNGLEALYDLFARAPWLGSLIDPRRAGADIFREGFDKLEPLIASILKAVDSDEDREIAVAAQGMAKAAELLAARFTLVATNVPFLGRGKQDSVIRNYVERHFTDAKPDLATAMLCRLTDLACRGGTVASVTPQNWLFLKSYKALRERLIKGTTLRTVAALGPRAFETIGGEVVNTALVTFNTGPTAAGASFAGQDANEAADAAGKAKVLRTGEIVCPLQADQWGNPDARISVNDAIRGPLLEKYAKSYQGVSPADFPHYGRFFWEITDRQEWRLWQSTSETTIPFSGRNLILWWNEDLEAAFASGSAYLRGEDAWGNFGVAVKQVGNLPVTIYAGEAFDTNVAVIVPNDPAHLPAIWCYCSSPDFAREVRRIDQKLNVTNATLVKIPFELAHWQKVATEKHPNSLPEPYSDDPTQWLFHGHQANAEDGAVLQVALARLLGYRWPAESETEMRLSNEARDWIARAGALNVACPPDHDGIVCLTAVKGEAPAQERLTLLLAEAFGADWSAAKLASLLAEAGFAGKSLDDWLRDGFFEQHCALFQNRPFIWHIWDGRRDGFQALVNYHRLAAPGGEGRRTLEKLIYSYLGDWIDRQRSDQKAGIEGADGRLAAAEHLRSELTKILEGEPPYDVFVRWKPLFQQPIGWEPDINDGVRMNIRPFITARPLGARAKTACILRTTPKSLKWGKDRGKEPARDKEDYPWFWGWDAEDATCAIDFAGGPKFDGNRWNEPHYSRAFKEAARARQAVKVGGKT